MPQFFLPVKLACYPSVTGLLLADGLPHRKRLLNPGSLASQSTYYLAGLCWSSVTPQGLMRKMYLCSLCLQIRKLRLKTVCLGDHKLVLGPGNRPLRSWPGATINCFLIFLWRVCDYRWTDLSPGDFWWPWGISTCPGTWRIP